MSAQPEALRLADELKTKGDALGCSFDRHSAELRRLHADLEHEKASRKAAQIENEDLKARIARSGVELQRAVLAEREACAKLCDELHWPWRMGDESGPKECAAAIRARGAAPQQTEGEKP